MASTYGFRVRDALLDLLAFSQMSDRLVAHGHEAYLRDETRRLAAEAITHRIGEAVTRLTPEFVSAHPSVAWRQIKGMRNLVAHDYGRVDYEIVWNTLTSDVPAVAAYVRTLLDRQN